MSDFTLAYRPYPDPDSPLQAAQIPWDSELFGFPCWDVRPGGEASPVLAAALSGFVAERKADGECLLVTKVPTGDVARGRVLAENGFYVVEAMLDIALPLARLAPSTAMARGAVLRPATPDDLPTMLDIAGSAFHDDRFHLDPSLSSEKADQRYRGWVERGFASGEPVFVYEDTRRGTILGFYHIRELPNSAVDLSLAAVHPSCQGSGIGALMYQAVLEECRQRGYQTAVTRIAVNNLPVANLFFRLGFTIREAMLTLHLHYQP
ncbi:MAG: GNAT family N-acetyltransferase [Armatimonadota bacterium]